MWCLGDLKNDCWSTAIACYSHRRMGIILPPASCFCSHSARPRWGHGSRTNGHIPSYYAVKRAKSAALPWNRTSKSLYITGKSTLCLHSAEIPSSLSWRSCAPDGCPVASAFWVVWISGYIPLIWLWRRTRGEATWLRFTLEKMDHLREWSNFHNGPWETATFCSGWTARFWETQPN